MNAHETSERAYQLWERAHRPQNHELDFWLAAEQECRNERVCVLEFGRCPFQLDQPTTGGRHVTTCTANVNNCRYRANNYNRRRSVLNFED